MVYVKAHVIQLGTPNPSHQHDLSDIITNPGNYVTGGLAGPGFVPLPRRVCLWGAGRVKSSVSRLGYKNPKSSSNKLFSDKVPRTLLLPRLE